MPEDDTFKALRRMPYVEIFRDACIRHAEGKSIYNIDDDHYEFFSSRGWTFEEYCSIDPGPQGVYNAYY